MIWPLSTPNIFVVYVQKHKVWVLVFLVRARGHIETKYEPIWQIFYFAIKPHLVEYLIYMTLLGIKFDVIDFL